MEESLLDYYLDAFSNMSRAVMRGKKAPHKPLLLLSTLNLIKKNNITCNHIYLSDELIKEFETEWNLRIGNCTKKNIQLIEGLTLDLDNSYPFHCNIVNPFYFLSFEPFWKLEKADTFIKRNSYSTINVLRKCFKYAILDETLFYLM